MFTTHGFSFKRIKFPAGEPHVTVERVKELARPTWMGNKAWIEYDHVPGENICEEIMTLLLLVDACKRADIRLDWLRIGYLPFGRQDRVANPGEPLSVAVFADLINSMDFPEVWIADPHSDVAPALIRNSRVVHQHELLGQFINEIKPDGAWCLVCPDAGARKKFEKLVEATNPPSVIYMEKKRSTLDGSLSDFYIARTIDPLPVVPEAFDLIIADDICDGGGTFRGIAKGIRKVYPRAKVTVVVSHGLFTPNIDTFRANNRDYLDAVYALEEKVL